MTTRRPDFSAREDGCEEQVTVVDLHVHSHYSRATSRAMTLDGMAGFARKKGIDAVGTGDFTHPEWIETLETTLRPDREGVYRHNQVRFVLTTEIAGIWRTRGRTYRIHLLVWAPNLEGAKRIAHELGRLGKLAADGRPIFSASARALCEAIWTADEAATVIPAHVWTPWYSLFGAKSGFDTLEECFGDLSPRIFALETGLSSDPAMNRRVSALDRYALVSFSDAHSPPNLGREATVLALDELTYSSLVDAIRGREDLRGTIEYYPQEGKYHYDGHRTCGVSLSPDEARSLDNRCPVCGRALTIGVLHRVEELADRDADAEATRQDTFWHLIPLREIVAYVLGVGTKTKAVKRTVDQMIDQFGTEFSVLLSQPLNDIERSFGLRIAEAIGHVRRGNVTVQPGYDGVFGEIQIPLLESTTRQRRR